MVAAFFEPRFLIPHRSEYEQPTGVTGDGVSQKWGEQKPEFCQATQLQSGSSPTHSYVYIYMRYVHIYIYIHVLVYNLYITLNIAVFSQASCFAVARLSATELHRCAVLIFASWSFCAMRFRNSEGPMGLPLARYSWNGSRTDRERLSFDRTAWDPGT